MGFAGYTYVRDAPAIPPLRDQPNIWPGRKEGEILRYFLHCSMLSHRFGKDVILCPFATTQ